MTPKGDHIWNCPPDLWEKLKPLAREMRHVSTPAERALWDRLRNRQLCGLKFRRQQPIERFVVDFYCAEVHLVVEIDGRTHDYTLEQDALRQRFLEARGLKVLRFSNEDVYTNMEGVLTTIALAAGREVG